MKKVQTVVGGLSGMCFFHINRERNAPARTIKNTRIPTQTPSEKSVKLKLSILTALATAILAGSASAQVYLSSTQPAAQALGATGTWDDSTTSNWATAACGSTYTTWSGAGSTIAGITGLTAASTITVTGSKTLTGLELYKNQSGGFYASLSSGASALMTRPPPTTSRSCRRPG
jgi:hypothetical protein